MTAPLSPMASTLVAILGRRKAMALMSSTTASNKGTVYVPATPKPSSKLVKIIGLAAAESLAQLYGGRNVTVPKCAAIQLSARHAEIVRMVAEGIPQVEVAKRFGMTDRNVRHVLAKARMAE